MTARTLAETKVPPASQQNRTPGRDLWQPYLQTADPALENALVEQYLPLVRTVVGRVAMSLPAHVSDEDLNSAGLIGLLQAIRNFDSKRGASFETFARFRIRGAVLDELRRLDWVPRLVHEKARKIQDALGELEQRLGQPPDEEQVAAELDLTPAEYRHWLEEVRPVAFVCLDATARAGAPDVPSQHESISDDSQENPSESASRTELKELIALRIRQLPVIQRKVLALYYFEDLRLREIAEAFGLTESRISQIHSQAILSIRSFIERQEAAALKRTGGGTS
jgi:RNA polymerase sigma factor for flagellar operon FliA